MMKHPVFILFDIFSRFLSSLPKRTMYSFADILFFVGYYIIGYRKKVVYENLRNAFPEKSSKEIGRIAKRFYKHLSDVIIEDIAMLHMSPKRLNQFVNVKDLELLDDLYQRNKNVIGILGHYGNWELLTTIPLHTDYTILTAYKPLKNKFFDRKIYEMRKRFDEVPIPMRQAYKSIAQYEKKGQPYIVGLVADQSPPKSALNFQTTFLNQKTFFFLGAEKIAKKFNNTVIFPAVKKIRRGFYEIQFTLLVEDPQKTKETEITEKYVRALEALIREKPEYWLWSHRRWKHKGNNV
ncbi:MAG: lysophospholipid acyltransferase family protein [Bacteroidales bacterium]|nr:lysophospholipid acyltransferase family protein [Bacteroidales bacterium]